MRNFYRRAGILLVLFMLVFQTVAMAAGAMTLNGVRFGKGAVRDRIVFDLSQEPQYTVETQNDGRRIVLTFSSLMNRAVKPQISSDMIQQVSFQNTKDGLQVIIDLQAKAEYTVKALANPRKPNAGRPNSVGPPSTVMTIDEPMISAAMISDMARRLAARSI